MKDLSFVDVARNKANDIYNYFFVIQKIVISNNNDLIKYKELAKINSINFIKNYILSTLDEPDLIFWESVINELELIETK